jgi:hypothetical protein
MSRKKKTFILDLKLPEIAGCLLAFRSALAQRCARRVGRLDDKQHLIFQTTSRLMADFEEQCEAEAVRDADTRSFQAEQSAQRRKHNNRSLAVSIIAVLIALSGAVANLLKTNQPPVFNVTLPSPQVAATK